MIKLFENYNEIAEICKTYRIVNWSINSVGEVDVEGNVYLYSKNLTKIPLKFGRVTGNFSCESNKLTTLEGAPSVGGDFNCRNNKLTTLQGAPREVEGGFFLIFNNNFPDYFRKFLELNNYDQEIIKQILKWQDEYNLWKKPEEFNAKLKWMMEDIQENDLPDIKIKFPEN